MYMSRGSMGFEIVKDDRSDDVNARNWIALWNVDGYYTIHPTLYGLDGIMKCEVPANWLFVRCT